MQNNNSKNKKTPITIIIASLIIIIAGVIFAKSIVIPFLMSLFLSVILLPPIRWLRSKKVPKSLSIIIVFVLIIVLFTGFGELIGSSLSSFSKDFPEYEQKFLKMEHSINIFLNERGINMSADKLFDIFDVSRVMGLTTDVLGQLGGFMGQTITILMLMLFLLFEMDSIALKARAITKNSNLSFSYFKTIGNNIRHYLSIKTLTSLLTGLLVWGLLYTIGLKYAILWGLIAFLFNYIPTIGSIIAAIPAVLFAMIELEFGGIIWTIIIFTSVNLIIGSLIEPKVMGKGLGLSTFIVFAGLIFWGFLLGTVGMFLSVPLTMTIKIILEQNERTKWIAVILGTQEDAKYIINEN